MTAQVLIRELETIIQESKKKHADLRTAAEKSLRELKALPTTSEAQLAADLRRRPRFSNPILSACKLGSSKLSLPAIVCLQRLVVSGGLAGDKLQELLEVFLECSKSNNDIQLRVLQSLPSLLQNYSDELQGELQASILQICATLQQAKAAAVSSTSAATLQQAISSIFEKVETEDAKSKSIAASVELNLDGDKLTIRPAAHDAYRVLDDLCSLTEGQTTHFIKGASIAQTFGLELMEAILANHGEIFDSHKELAFLLRNRVMPLVTRFLSERLSFAITVRTTRLLCIALREHLKTIHTDCEIPLSLLNHNLESDGSSSLSSWRRALCMETFRVIYCTPNLATDVYRLLDQNSDRRNFIQENLALFVRLAAEKPSLIGVGQQSSIPAGPTVLRASGHDQAVIDAGNVAGIISGDIGLSEVNATGISMQWSTMKTPCLDLLDKSEPPTIPETYVYSLVLTCLNGLSEGLARVVLPLTAQGKFKPVQDAAIEATSAEDVAGQDSPHHEPSLENGPHQEPPDIKSPQIKPLAPAKSKTSPAAETISHMVNECWPAMLATSSTFLYAALDADFYRGLIRSVQKFTQVAGLLRLATPRDAFLTTLAKSAIPPNLLKGDPLLSPGASPSPRIGSTSDFFSEPQPTNKAHSRRGSFDSSPPSLGQRNLMCLRALINLAIALGTTLDKSWSIITESLQKADIILAQSGTVTSREYRASTTSVDGQGNDPGGKQSGLNAEISAVEAAVTRLLQATGEFPSEAFLYVLRGFCNLLGDTTDLSATATGSVAGSLKMPRRTSSTAMLATSPAAQSRSVQFALSKLGEISRINVNRLSLDVDSGAWGLLTDKLTAIAASPSVDNTARLMAADILGSIALGITLDTIDDDADARQEVQLRALASLERLVDTLYENLNVTRTAPSSADIDVHRGALEALRAILEKCGDSLTSGWRSIFTIVRSTFQVPTFADDEEEEEEEEEETDEAQYGQTNSRVISPKIARSAFACVQLICSDFLQSLKRIRIINLIDLLSQFCGQKTDLNISLSTVTLFWNLSDFLQTQLSSTLSNDEIKISQGIQGNVLREAAETGSLAALWMILQSQLAFMTRDDRVEVRNSAVQTAFRIVDTTDELSDQFWTFSFQKVILEMLQINIRSHQKRGTSSKEVDSQSIKSLESTTDMILKGLARTLTSNLETIAKFPAFDSIWSALLDHFASLFALGSNEIYASIFDFLAQILATAENDGSLGDNAVRQTLDILQSGIPKSQSQQNPSGTEKALVAYVNSLKQIYGLVHTKISPDQLIKMVRNVYSCILASTATPYSSDVDSPTALQSVVLECFEGLRSDLPGVPSVIIEHLAGFSTLPYEAWKDSSNFGGLTFVAFSKKSIDLLQQFVLKHTKTKEIYETGMLNKGVRALCLTISFKYRHNRQGKQPAMWKKATTALIELLPNILPEIETLDFENSLKSELCLSLGQFKEYITYADQEQLPSGDTVFEDEAFDLQATETLRRCFGIRLNLDEKVEYPLLRSLTLTDETRFRASYVDALFRSSLIHDGVPSTASKPLQRLRKLRPGRTYDPPFKRRVRMSYDCFDELFALVSMGLNDSSENTQKASGNQNGTVTLDGENGWQCGNPEAALPNSVIEHLLLRCALPLQRFIVDQPLRGKMPTPTSQRLELLYVLRKIRDLNCVVGRDVNEYFDDPDRDTDVASEIKFRVPVLKPWKRHLEWLLPLVNGAAVHARHDAEIAAAIQDVLDVAFSRED